MSSGTSHRQRGVTLIELMIVVVVIAILASIAMPSYRRYVMRGHRSSAQAAMMDIANRQQQILLANRSYADVSTLTTGGYVLPPEVSDNYTLAIATDAGPPPTFTITLTPTGGQASDGALTLDNRGNKTPADKWKGR